MGTSHGLHLRSKDKILLDMATDPDYVMTENDTHVLGRDVEVAEAIYRIDLKKIMKYLRYKPMAELIKGRTDLTGPGQSGFGQAVKITEMSLYDKDAEGSLQHYIRNIYLMRSGEFFMVDVSTLFRAGTGMRFTGIRDLCLYIDSRDTDGRSRQYSDIRLNVDGKMHSYRHSAAALSRAMIYMIDSVIEDRCRWLEILEQTSTTAKRRMKQIDL